MEKEKNVIYIYIYIYMYVCIKTGQIKKFEDEIVYVIVGVRPK